MHSINYQFQEIQRLNPYWSSWTCFTELLPKIENNKIGRWFNKLVEKEDYLKSEKKKLVSYLKGLKTKVKCEGDFSEIGYYRGV